jgi:uncharacterized protein YkwD
LLAAAPASAAAKRRCVGASVAPKQTTLPRAYAAVLCLVNRERARRGVRALRESALLARAASDHSLDMVSQQYFDHEGMDGSTPRQRVLRTGYFRGAGGGAVEEALACGWMQLSTPKALVANLMRSSTHRSILLDRRLRAVGVGLVLGGPDASMAGGATLTLDFASR